MAALGLIEKQTDVTPGNAAGLNTLNAQLRDVNEQNNTTKFILNAISVATSIGSTEESTNAIKDSVSHLTDPKHRELLEVIADRLGLDAAILTPEARQEAGAGGFHRETDIETLGVLCFISELIEMDYLRAQTVGAIDLASQDLQDLRSNVESALKKIFTQRGSPWGVLLEKLEAKSCNSFEKALVRGVLDIYIDLPETAPATGLHKFLGIFAKKEEPTSQLAKEIRNINLELGEESFVHALVAAVKTERELEEREKALQLARKAEADQLRVREAELALAKVEAEQRLEETKLRAAEESKTTLEMAVELQKIRQGISEKVIKLEDIPSMTVSIVNEPSQGAIENIVVTPQYEIYCAASKVALTYTDIDAMKARDQKLAFADNSQYERLQRAWRWKLAAVMNKGLKMQIPDSLAFKILELDVDAPLRSVLSAEKSKTGGPPNWHLSLANPRYTDSRPSYERQFPPVSDQGWGNLTLQVNRGQFISEAPIFGYDPTGKKDEALNGALQNIVLNLIVQAVELVRIEGSEPAFTYEPLIRVP